MKKFLLLISLAVILVGCDSVMNNPTKRVETFLNKYQTMDKEVLSQLDTTLNNNSDLTKNQKEELIQKITNFKLEIIDSNSYDASQVCMGGVPLTEINPNTMESIKTKGLYLTGELLDVDGNCGGYNLTFAWISGYLAGISIKGEFND